MKILYKILLLGILLAIGSLLLFSYSPINTSVTSIVIKEGSSANQVINKLATKEIIKNKLYFKILIFLKAAQDNLQAGEYAVNKLNPLELLNNFISGEIKQYQFTIIEGWTVKQLLTELHDNANLIHKTKGNSDKQILALLNSSYNSLEGIFFPDTYFFHHGMSDLEILQTSYNKMQQELDLLWDSRIKNTKIRTKYKALTLASIIEKETADYTESGKISGVYHTRLNMVMHLNADPTVLYGLYGNFDQKLSKKDLLKQNKYNSYLNYGLPPTPIALPSLKAIKAALNPEKSNALYFVAKPDGSHHFSSTLADHVNATNEIRNK